MVKVNGVTFSSIEDALEVGHSVKEMEYVYEQSQPWQEYPVKASMIKSDKRVEDAIRKAYRKDLFR